MIIKEIRLENYRNYEKLDIKLNNRFNVIYGNNAQGKTNILESLYLCATGRSHRTDKERELVRFNQKGYDVKISLEKKDIDIELEYRFLDGKKFIRVNEIGIDKLNKLIGNLVVVLFSPEDIILLKEDPAGRRRFLDIAISQVKPSYFHKLQQYRKILANRNALLKQIKMDESLINSLSVWDESLVEVGSEILFARINFIKRLEDIIKPKHLYLTTNKEDIKINYKDSIHLDDENSLIEIKERFLERLQKKKKDDLYKTYTSLGPHRDDFEIELNGVNVKNFGSQGQQRTTMLSLKLAEIDIIKESIGEYPILLLDDFASELDKHRHEKFIGSLESMQVFITSTDKDIINDIQSNVKYFNVENGCVVGG